jgi:hypothetical protein
MQGLVEQRFAQVINLPIGEFSMPKRGLGENAICNFIFI